MVNPNRPSVDAALARFIDGEPEPEDGRLLADALREDVKLQRELSGLLAVDELLRQHAAVEGPPAPDAAMGARTRPVELPDRDDRFGWSRPLARSRWVSWSSRATKALVLLVFLVGPLAIITFSAYRFGDFGLALPGWAASVHLLVQRTAMILASALSVCLMGAVRLRWVRRPLLCALGSGASLLTATVACQVTLSDYTEREIIRREEMIQNNRWVSYDSVFYWPEDQATRIGHPEQEPNANQIRDELTTLRQAGFTGLYIHECRTGLVDVSRIAREVGFTAILQGIRVADSQRLDAAATQLQIRNAISVHSNVDAYCLGELSARKVDWLVLKEELAKIRQQTSKPVTTSFIHDEYAGKRGDRLRALEDFTVRALARPWSGNSGRPDQAVRAVQDALQSFYDDDKPSLLTYVFYPSGGGEGFTEENQYQFFKEVKALRIPRGVNVVAFNSFDRPWAKRLSEVDPQTPAFEAYTGLFATRLSADGQDAEFLPKQATVLFRND